MSLIGIRQDPTIPTPEYEINPEHTQYNSARSQESPTKSNFSQLNIIEVFEVNKEDLRK